MMKKLFIFLAMMPFVAQAGNVPHWKTMDDKSSIQWTVISSGKPLSGFFPAFSSDIIFDAAQLEQSSVSVEIKTGEVKTDDADARQSLPDNNWFASKQYPSAVFSCAHFKHLGADRYLADGTLTLRGKILPVQLPFTLKMKGNSAVMDGEATLKRLDFGVGQGDWADTSAVANEVKVKVHLEAALTARGG